MLGTDFMMGSPSWLDLAVPDPEAAAAFYGAVFGWVLQPTDGTDHGVLLKDGKAVAGLRTPIEAEHAPGWTVYFQTPDADSTAVVTRDVGGEVREGPLDIARTGRTAFLTDPTGTEFAVWEPEFLTGLEIASEPDALAWLELHTTDPASAESFYRSLFGWRTSSATVGDLTRTVLATGAGDRDDVTFGAVVAAETDTRWTPLVAVADLAASTTRVRDNGGILRTDAVDDIPGTIIRVADPAGVGFGLVLPRTD